MSIERLISRHARKRFYERIGYMTDKEIVDAALCGVDGFKFVWKPCKKLTRRKGRYIEMLVTVLPIEEELYDLRKALLNFEEGSEG